MMSSRSIALTIAGLTSIVALGLVVERGGLLAWSALVLGCALLVKIGLRPSKRDPGFSIGLAATLALAWVGTWYYVISTWESGEVVELAMNTSNGAHAARVWVLETGSDPLIYYDAEPEVAKSLFDGKPLQYTRAGKVSTRTPAARRVDELSEEEANLIFAAMGAKYGERMDAADIYYLMLGRSRDRVALVASLIER